MEQKSLPLSTVGAALLNSPRDPADASLAPGPNATRSESRASTAVLRFGRRGGRTAAGERRPPSATLRQVLGRAPAERNRRQSFLLKQQKKRFLDDQFRLRVFVKFFLYHVFFPLSVPVVLLVDGLTLAINMDMWFVSTFGGFFNQWVMFLVLAAPTGVLIGTNEGSRNVCIILCGLSWTVYMWRQFIIGMKYAYYSKEQLRQLTTARLQAREKSLHTLRAWSLMPKSLYGRQVRLAALRLDQPEATEALLYLEPDQVSLLRVIFPKDESLLPAPPDNTISIFNMIIMLYRKAHSEIPAPGFARDFLLSTLTPLVFIVWWATMLYEDPLPVTWLTVVVLVLFTASFSFFSIVIFTFLRVAVLDFKRRAFALQTLNSLVEVTTHILPDGTTKQLAIIPLHYAHNIERILALRRLVKDFGYCFYRRIQVVMTTNCLVFVCIVTMSIIFTFVTNVLVAPMIMGSILNLLFLTEALLSMIIAGGAANESVVLMLRGFRSVQIQMLAALEDVDYPKLAEMKQKGLSSLLAKASTSSTTNPLALLTNSLNKQQRLKDGDVHSYLATPGVRIEVEVCAENINSAARHLEDEDTYNPVTLFGLTAGPNLLKFVATLAFSAASVGLRNVIVSALDLLRAQSALA